MKPESKKQNKQKNVSASGKRGDSKRANITKLPSDFVPSPELERYLELSFGCLNGWRRRGFRGRRKKIVHSEKFHKLTTVSDCFGIHRLYSFNFFYVRNLIFFNSKPKINFTNQIVRYRSYVKVRHLKGLG